jgi:YHS domain-containing protein
MTGLIIKIVLVLLVVRILWTFVRGVLEGVGIRQPPQDGAVKLVRDPVCGVFVVPARALQARSGSTTAYFCSEKCRREWDGR